MGNATLTPDEINRLQAIGAKSGYTLADVDPVDASALTLADTVPPAIHVAGQSLAKYVCGRSRSLKCGAWDW